MFSFFKGVVTSIFSKGDNVDKVVDGAIKGLDATFYTPEEKAVAGQKILDWKLQYAKVTTGQDMARRVIAFGIVGLWIALVLLGCAAKFFNNNEFANFCLDILKNVVTNPFLLIMGFYYAAHIIRSQKK